MRRTCSHDKLRAWCIAVMVAAGLFVHASMAVAEPVSTPTVAPHVPTAYDTDVCAMCHRTHTSADSTTWEGANDSSHSALLTGSGSTDVGLCYSCHGVAQLGSGTDVESSFDATSAHGLAPAVSAYGTTERMQCSTCHDSHGSARTASDTAYPALLRVLSADRSATYYSGNDVCYQCHTTRPASMFPGKKTFELSPHASIDVADGGTKVVCSACHVPHGSPVAPLLRSELATPSAPATAAVTGDDRSLCLGCHPVSEGAWPGPGPYAGSAHGSTPATVPVAGEFASIESSRTAGECQSCHRVHGAVDASGTVIPSLLGAKGATVCYDCHTDGGSASTDFEKIAFSPSTPGTEVIAGWQPQSADEFARAQVFTRASGTASIPVGPRELSVVTTMSAMAVGDIDGDGWTEQVVSDGAAARVAIVRGDRMRSLVSTLVALPNGPAAHLESADIFVDATMLPELVSADTDGALTVSRWNAGTLSSVATASVPATITAIACGDVTGTAAAEIAVITEADELYLFTESAGALTRSGPFATLEKPVDVHVADIDAEPSKAEIVVANGVDKSKPVSLFDGDGARYADGGGNIQDGAVPVAILAANVLAGIPSPAGTSGREIVLTYSNDDNVNGVRVIEQPVGVGDVTDYDFAVRTRPGPLAWGDVDVDGVPDLVVGLRGSFTRDTGAVAPSISVLTSQAAGTDLGIAFTLAVGGTQLASEKSFVAVADMGPIAPSRHPVGVAGNVHSPSEALSVVRHVECADCHNPHQARGDAADTAAQEGELIGALGVSRAALDTTPAKADALSEYEVCYACHSAASPSAPIDVADQFVTTNASFHPVEGASPETSATGSVLTAYGASLTRVKCTDCHGSSGGAPSGPHASAFAPLLSRRQSGAAAADANSLCYLCHRYDIYGSGDEDGKTSDRSGFYHFKEPNTHRKLHSFHVARGVNCAACHVSHGSEMLKANLSDVGYVFNELPAGGECASSCHTDGATRHYDRPLP